MPATVSSRSRKADTLLQNEPVTKKQRLESSKSQPKPPQTIAKALFTNGTPNKLEAKSSKIQSTKSSHAVNDAKSNISTTVGQRAAPQQDAVIEISSDSESEEDDDDENEVDGQSEDMEENGEVNHTGEDGEVDGAVPIEQQEKQDRTVDSDKENKMDMDEENADEPTFGELLSTAPIDVQSALTHSNNDEDTSLALQQSSRTLGLSSTTSLATVLSQALKTNDRSLLETCFMTNDLASVRSTIQRLPSSQVEALLHHIADKMHKRPGRASNLMVWIQWSLVSHGGYLARRKDIVNKLGALNRVIKERANGLQPLLVLKGKLDMLAAQLELRREMMQAHQKDMDDDDDVVIYVEGQEDADKSGNVGDEDDSNDDEDDDEEDDVDIDLDGQANLETLDVDDSDDDESADSSEEEEVSDEGFSDQEVEAEESASDIDDDSDEEVDEAVVNKPDRPKKRKASVA